MTASEPVSPPRQRKTEPARPSDQEPRTRPPKGRNSGARDEIEDPKKIGPWKIGRIIGKGSSGRVKIAKHRVTGQYAAVKIVPKHMLLSSRMSVNEAGAKADKMLLGIEREIVIMKLIEHPNVMRLYDVWETGSELYLIMEFVEGGELFDYLVNRGKLHEDEALHYFQQIICGVDYCHRFNICHRDLKPENLLLDNQRNIKIADFGMAALEASDKLLETSCGSPHYASPEIVSGLTYHGSSSDIWSCGVILFALLIGRLPFDDENVGLLLNKVRVGKFYMPPELSRDAQSLIRGMLTVNPERRMTMDEIKSHPWFTRLAPRPQPDYIAPPTPDQITKAVGTASELDYDIVSNLQTLWFGASEESIVKALISDELSDFIDIPLLSPFSDSRTDTLNHHRKCWEKVFYFLLAKYRQRHLENFNDEDSPEPTAVKEKPPKPKTKRPPREHVVKTGAVRSRSRQSIVSLTRRAAHQGNTAPSPKESVSGSPRHVVTRPAPAAPKMTPRIIEEEADVSPSGSETPRKPNQASDTASYPLASKSSRPLPQPPQKPLQSGADVDAVYLANTTTPARGTAHPRVGAVPQILLQEATPSPAPRARASIIKRTEAVEATTPPSPSPKSPRSPTPSIKIPQTGDAAMQRFFHDIVDQLQTMSMRSPNLHEGALGGSAPNSPYAESPNSEQGDNQFEDAYEDEDEDEEGHDQARSNLSGSYSAESQRNSDGTASSEFVLVADPSIVPTVSGKKSKPKPLSILRPSRNSNSRAQTRSLAKQQVKAQLLSHKSSQEMGYSDHSSTRRVSSQGSGSRIVGTNDKENLRTSMPGDGSTGSWGNKGKGREMPGLAIQSPPVDMPGAFETTNPNSRKSRKSFRRGKDSLSPGPPSPLSPASSVFTDEGNPSSPRVSWFANLFSWKAVTYQLMSVDNCTATRVEARRVLEQLSCVIAVENSDGAAVLRCRYEDRSGGTARSSVKFKVEFVSQSPSGSGTPTGIVSPKVEAQLRNGYATAMTLSLEKGNAATFKLVCNGLRRLWELDIPNTQPVGLGVHMIPTPIHSPVV
ncbi:uncharacterized protein MELLADRAFT_77643 [Melampsora larici-populina 98AG31]|uniref:non-specific serine/threonine protein kinase n=1 Tax=Melampsora larici-populina (strain 98AG31 / pathotype 3-4-7) TaxID=747676 RepID=F4RK47_MELLP|nr:uncharacterized protein MELLADRAFT_77643 [Melampsora larici-populina 98AG31]EGG07247.1 hypothetical protein MELLADRAFT_77643 [Melampsora larici-populina 98AG31]